VCDRKTGECKCFEGYEGKGCRRSTCPESCSGHGTCEYIDELAGDYYDRRTGPGALYRTRSGTKITTKISDHTTGAQTVSNVVTRSANTEVYHGFLYDLWDAQKIQGCKCDLGYSGPDCASRVAPKGDDPLTTVKSERMKQAINIGIANDYEDLSGFTVAGSAANGDAFTSSAAHGLAVNDQVTFDANFGDANEFAAGTAYYVITVGTTTTFQLATTVGGTARAHTGDHTGATGAINKAHDFSAQEFALIYHDPYGGVWRTDGIEGTQGYDDDKVAANVQAALRDLPNQVLSGVTVAATSSAGVSSCHRTTDGVQHIDQAAGSVSNGCATTATSQLGAKNSALDFTITFADLPGQTGVQYLFEVDTATRGDGSFPRTAGITQTSAAYSVVEVMTAANLGKLSELAECSDRGLDNGQGECECFDGFRGLACEEQEALV